MARDFGREIREIKTVGDLIEVLKGLENEGRMAAEYPELKLILDYLRSSGIEIIEENAEVEIDVGKFELEAEKQLDQSVVPTAKIRELLEEYEKYLEIGEEEQTALGKLLEEYNGRISKRQIEALIKRREEVYQKAVSKLAERKAADKLGEEGIRKTAEEIAREVVVLESETEGQIPPDIRDHVVKEIREIILEATAEELLKQNFKPEELKKKIEATIGQLEPEKWKIIMEAVINTPKATVASLEMDRATTVIVDGLLEELKMPDQLGKVLVEEREPELRETIRIKVLEIMKGRKVQVEVMRKTMVEQTNTAIDTSVRKAIVRAESFRQENPDVVKIVAFQDLRERIESEMIITERPSQTDWVRRLPLIRNYEQIVEGFVVDRPEITGVTPEASVLLKTLNLSPKEFDTRVKEYQAIRDRIMIPYNVPEAKTVDDTMRMVQDEPTRRLIHAGQRVIRIQKFLERFGFKGKIGTETFFNNSIPLLKQYGFEGGTKLVLREMMGGGTSGKLLRFFGGMDGPLGWLGTGATMGGRATFGGLGGIGEKLFGTTGKLIGGKLTSLGGALVKFLKGAVPKLGTMGATALGGVLAIPSLVTISAAAIGTVVIAVIVGLFAYSMLQSWQISSIVPPMTGGGTGLNLVDWDPNKQIPEGCPQGFPVNGGVITQGPSAGGNCNHYRLSFPAIDVGLNTGSPIMATHNGIAQAGHDSSYGYYVAIKGKCQGKEFLTVYAHMLNLPFNGEEEVKKGDQIGIVDDSGNSTGPHIHYEIRDLPDRIESYLGLGFSIDGCCDNCPQR